ncbi:30737_t:CDS:2, partial [Racocetra persica]
MSQITPSELHDYQRQAADQLTEKYLDYRRNSLKIKDQTVPFLKLLSSVTGSGKTAILAQTQTYHNLKEKYKSLVPSAQVKSFL